MLSDLVEPYLRARYARGDWSRATAHSQRSTLVAFAATFGARPVHRLARSDVQRWLEGTGNLSAGTRGKQFSTIRGFCQWLCEHRKVRHDPTMGLRGPRRPRTVPRALTGEAVAAVLAVAPDQRARLIAVLMVQQGLRRAEVAHLQLGDIDQRGRTMRVIGKGGHERVLPITDETMREMRVYLDQHPAPRGPLVRSFTRPHDSLHPVTVGGIVRAMMTEAGVKVRAGDGVSGHALRHTAATDMLRAGANVRDVQRVLGHAHLVTTETYLPLVVDSLEKAMGGRSYLVTL